MNNMRSITPPMDRFMAAILVNEDTNCWEWKQYTHKGYARFNNGIKVVEAHRWIYEQLVDKIPTGLQLDHLCRVRRCVNPYHLEPVTTQENTRRGDSIVASRMRQTHCKRGHKLSGNNLSMLGTHRRCLKCHALRERRRRKGIVVCV